MLSPWLFVPPLVFVLVCGAFGALIWLATARAVHPVFPDDLGALNGYKFATATQTVHFRSLDGVPLVGWFVPSGRPRSATVILLEGYGQGRAAMLPQAAYLHHAGYNTLLFDYRGTGQSGGSAFTFGIKEPLDVRGAVNYLLTRTDVDPDRIAVQGVSIGAVIGILAMAQDPHIHAVVAESAFPSLTDMIQADFSRYTRLPLHPFGVMAIWVMEHRLGGNVNGVSPIVAVGKMQQRPLFIIDDLQDKLLPADSGEQLYAAATGPKELWLVKDTAHASGFFAWPQAYADRVLQFYATYLPLDATQPADHAAA